LRAGRTSGKPIALAASVPDETVLWYLENLVDRLDAGSHGHPRHRARTVAILDTIDRSGRYNSAAARSSRPARSGRRVGHVLHPRKSRTTELRA